ncbi:helix-turn-helix domain-containing protein [Cupriavidus necator]|uniref:AraC-like ligand-binding domain-containing protein n=1 Tax=Cupriavidus necator TaxID=106590 RepID=UPI00069132FC|nr:helix-turn-helix domain-containing protein [Cupriavidus necator]
MNIFHSTIGVVDSKRFAYWQDVVCDTFVQIDCIPLSDRPFFGEISTALIDDLQFSQVRSRDHQVMRTSRRIDGGREEYTLMQFQLSGNSIVVQDGRDATIAAGDCVCYDSVRPYTLQFRDDFEALVFQIPRQRLVGRLGQTERMTARAIRGDSLLGTLTVPFMRQLGGVVSQVDPAVARRLSSIAVDLVTAALGDLISVDEHQPSWAGTALKCRAKAVIEESLHDPDLNTERVAAVLGISPRYLQSLFHEEGETVRDCIWRRRLERARRDLADPLLGTRYISQIAMDNGFNNFAHFSKRFRTAFGVSPREYKATLVRC